MRRTQNVARNSARDPGQSVIDWQSLNYLSIREVLFRLESLSLQVGCQAPSAGQHDRTGPYPWSLGHRAPIVPLLKPQPLVRDDVLIARMYFYAEEASGTHRIAYTNASLSERKLIWTDGPSMSWKAHHLSIIVELVRTFGNTNTDFSVSDWMCVCFTLGLHVACLYMEVIDAVVGR